MLVDGLLSDCYSFKRRSAFNKKRALTQSQPGSQLQGYLRVLSQLIIWHTWEYSTDCRRLNEGTRRRCVPLRELKKSLAEWLKHAYGQGSLPLVCLISYTSALWSPDFGTTWVICFTCRELFFCCGRNGTEVHDKRHRSQLGVVPVQHLQSALGLGICQDSGSRPSEHSSNTRDSSKASWLGSEPS